MAKVLIAYFSRAGKNYVAGDIVDLPEGNTAVAARLAAEHLEAAGHEVATFEIVRAMPYADDYRECVDEARRELAENARPELAVAPGDVSGYDAVLLAYPNWCATMPMPVYTFLDACDLAGKKVMPLCTNEGSGLSQTEADIARECPGASVTHGLSLVGHRVAESAGVIARWLDEVL